MQFDFKELESQAFHGTIDISGLPPAEYKYFDKLREICFKYRRGEITKEEINRLKKLYFKNYRDDKLAEERHAAGCKDWQENIKRSESFREVITKTDSRDIALDAALRCIAVMTGDNVWLKTNDIFLLSEKYEEE